MITYFLGQEEVTAYLRDFLQRLKRFDPFPSLWCPMTISGNELLAQMLPLLTEEHSSLVEKISVLPIEVAEGSPRIRFGGKSPRKDVAGKSVLLFDSSIHSGSTMTEAVRKLLDLGAQSVCTYSFVVKRGTSFIPTVWGVMINETDRAFFLLKEIPNQRLHTASEKAPAAVHLERLSKHHLKQPRVKCGVRSMDCVTWGTRFFDMRTTEQDRCSYLLYHGKQIAGYLTVHFSAEGGALVVDEVAVDKAHRGKKWGGLLIRFAETLARQSNCRVVRLYAIKEQVEFYKHNQYSPTSGPALELDGEEYIAMERPVLHSRLY